MIFSKILKAIYTSSIEDIVNAITKAVKAFRDAVVFRVKRVKEEAEDVSEALSEVKEQIKDVGSAAKGSKRRGRPKKK